ncbi:17600_t:CDS:2, partial [Acaulospora colombiana]
QTHIFPEIRVDAIKVLELLLDVIPEVVVSQGSSGHGERVLNGYLGLLVSTSSRSESAHGGIFTGSISQRSIPAKRKYREQPLTQDLPIEVDEQIEDRKTPSTPFIWNNDQMMECHPWGEDELVNAIEAVSLPRESSNSSKMNDIIPIAEKFLHQFLVDMCLEYGPSTLLDLGGSAKDKLELRLLHAILKLAHALYLPMLM